MLYVPFAEVFYFVFLRSILKFLPLELAHVLFSLFLDIYRFIPVLKSIYVKKGCSILQLPAQHQWARSVWFFLLCATVYHINWFPVFQLFFTFLQNSSTWSYIFLGLKCCDLFAIFYCKFFWVIFKWDWYMCFLCI